MRENWLRINRATALIAAAAFTFTTGCAAEQFGESSIESSPPTSESIAVPDGFRNAIEADLGISASEYFRQGDLAARAADAYPDLIAVPGVNAIWIDRDTIHVGVSSPAATHAVEGAGFTASPTLPTAQITDWYNQFREWRTTLSTETNDAITLAWPDYVTGSISVVRNQEYAPTQTMTYPTDLPVTETPGFLPAPSADRPPRLPVPPLPSQPGDGFIASSTATNRSTCTLGVPVSTRHGDAVLTAAHCADEGAMANSLGGEEIGTYQPPFNPTDAALIITGTPLDLAVRVNGESFWPTGATSPIIGAPVCKAGHSTGWRCGRIRGVGATFGELEGEYITDACALAGDSGGPSLQGSRYVGITSVSTLSRQSQCPPRGNPAYLAYTGSVPLPPPAAYGITPRYQP